MGGPYHVTVLECAVCAGIYFLVAAEEYPSVWWGVGSLELEHEGLPFRGSTLDGGHLEQSGLSTGGWRLREGPAGFSPVNDAARRGLTKD